MATASTSTSPAPTAALSAAPGNTSNLPEESAETAAAAAALVVDSVVEGTVAAVLTSSNLPASSGATPETTNDFNSNPAQQTQPTQSQDPPVPATETSDAKTSSTVQTYNNQQKNKRKERLEQNRISARESRKRKKSMIEELQRTVIALTAENKELNGRNRSLRTNLADIGRKYPNSASIQAILSGVPNPSPQQQPQSPVPTNARGTPVMAPSQYLQQHTVPVVPIMTAAGHPTMAPPGMVVPYMYIPQPAHAPGGLVQIAAPPRHPGQPVVVQAAPVAQPAASGAQPPAPPRQQHIVIAPQPSPAVAAQPPGPQAPLLPVPPAAPVVAPSAIDPVPNPMATAAATAAAVESIQETAPTAPV